MSIKVKNDALAKGWEYFDIMHKERKVARIHENGSCKIYFPSFMPYNLYLEEDTGEDLLAARINNLTNFYYWCASRVLTLDRKYAKAILNSIGAYQATTDRERAAIAISYRGLSLLDVYWIKGKADKEQFSTISLYRHSLADAFVDVSLRGKQMTIENAEFFQSQEQASDLGTPGVAPKAWIKENGEFFLLKDGDERDVYAELLASKIIGCFKVDHVSYEQSSFGGSLVSKCKIISSEEKSLVTCEYVNVYCVNQNKDKFDFILKKDEYGYYMMNILDYLTGNTDRHWGNWGFYVDNQTNKLEKLYPLMDFNKCFTAYDKIDGAICQTTKERCSQRQAAIDAVKKIGLNLVSPIDESWFEDEKIKEMFFARLQVLQEVEVSYI